LQNILLVLPSATCACGFVGLFSASGCFASAAGKRFLVVSAAARFRDYAVLLDLLVEALEHALKAFSRLGRYVGQLPSPLYEKKPGFTMHARTRAGQATGMSL